MLRVGDESGPESWRATTLQTGWVRGCLSANKEMQQYYSFFKQLGNLKTS